MSIFFKIIKNAKNIFREKKEKHFFVKEQRTLTMVFRFSAVACM